MTTTTHPVTVLRTGVTADGKCLELQLIYGNARGGTLWFQLSRQQAQKLYRELEALLEEEPVWTPLLKKPIELME